MVLCNGSVHIKIGRHIFMVPRRFRSSNEPREFKLLERVEVNAHITQKALSII